jgi:hypothetical protein
MAGSEQLELFVANARQYWVAAIFHNNANCVFRIIYFALIFCGHFVRTHILFGEQPLLI